MNALKDKSVDTISAITAFMSTFEKLKDGCTYSKIICKDSLTLDDTFLLPFVKGVGKNLYCLPLSGEEEEKRGTNTGNILIQYPFVSINRIHYFPLIIKSKRMNNMSE